MWFVYIILAIISIYIIFMAYMKIRFHFWSIQPVFHIYNLFHWYTPFKIIKPELPEMNKYVNLIDISTKDVTEMSNTDITRFCNFIKSYYLHSKGSEYLPKKRHIMEYLYASNHPSFISIYKSPSLLFAKDNCISYDEFYSVMSARVLHISFKDQKTFPVYYVDNLCVHPSMRKKGIAPKSIQTLYYNLRRKNAKIKVFLFKREGEMTAIVPLCIYDTYGYDVQSLPHMELMHASIKLIQITSQNLHLAVEFIFNRSKLMTCMIVPEVTNILNLMKSGNIILYALIENDYLISLYFYRDAAILYQDQKTMECIGSLSACPFEDIFLAGFFMSVRKSAKQFKTSKVLIENTSNNTLVNKYIETQNIIPFLKSPTGFFLYNYVSYTLPADKCFILY